ncbi:MAG: NAD-dependent epimerase/dehydratase family protein [Myxococcota bacterium]
MSDRPAVLILGGGGFIGQRLRLRLMDRYDLLTVDIRRPAPVHTLMGAHPQPQPWERIAVLDQGDPNDVEQILTFAGAHRERLAGVVHLTAYYDFRNQPDVRYDRLENTFRALLLGLDQLLPDGAPILHSSSMAAMAPTEPGQRQTADSPRLGAWAYPRHKLAMERIIENLALQTPRPLAELVLAGVYSDRAELVPLFQQIERIRARRIEALFYPGATDRGLTYVHVDDVAAAFDLGLERLRDRPAVHRLLIGEPEPVSYEDIHVRAGQAFHGQAGPLFDVPPWVAKAGAAVLGWLGDQIGVRRFLRAWMVDYAGEHFAFDLSDTEAALGWQPQVHLRERLDVILQFAHTHPELWLEVNHARPW